MLPKEMAKRSIKGSSFLRLQSMQAVGRTPVIGSYEVVRRLAKQHNVQLDQRSRRSACQGAAQLTGKSGPDPSAAP
jgi:hypothetical protein